MAREYVRKVEGVLKVAGTRVSLDSLVYAFREGLTAECIVESFPVLTLEQVYGAIAYYLANRAVVDKHLIEEERHAQVLHAESRQRNADLIARLRARHENPVPRGR